MNKLTNKKSKCFLTEQATTMRTWITFASSTHRCKRPCCPLMGLFLVSL